MSNPVELGGEIPTDTRTTMEMLDKNPEDVYSRLRQTMPIVRLQALAGRIIFTKAEDTTRLKTDGEYFGSFDTKTPMQRAFGGHTLMRKDGCPHLHERSAMEPALAYGQVQQWKQAFERLTDHLLDKLEARATADLFHAFAVPLSTGYLKLVLGLDAAGENHLFKWANSLVRGAMNSNFDPVVFAVSDCANMEMDACFNRMIEQKIDSPDGSILSVMANNNNPLAISQIRTNMKICIGGAVIETRDALLSTIYGLLSHPDQLRHCISGNGWGSCCEEGLRWIAPIQASPRVVKKSLIMRGLLIPEGETVLAVQASANYDEDLWDNPGKFDIHRFSRRHQTFGEGAHQCLGGSVYRLLAADVALPKLFKHFPALSLAHGTHVSVRGFAFRGPTSLHVELI